MPTPLRANEPLGPLNYQHLSDSSALSLLDLHDPLLRALRVEPRLLIGRKGSGKSTILYATQFFDDLRPRLQREHINDDSFDAATRHVISIKTYAHFEPLVKFVYDSLFGSISPSEMPTVSTDRVGQEWEDRLWAEIIRYFYSKHMADPETYPRDEFSSTIAFCDENFRHRIYMANNATGQDGVSAVLDRIIEGAKEEIRQRLVASNRKLFLLIDSLEEYPVFEKAWRHVCKGFLPALEGVQKNSANMIVAMAALPEEIEHIFRDLPGSEPGKHFSSHLRLRWKPIELKRIVAHRFALMLKDICSERSQLCSIFNDYDVYTFEKLRDKVGGLDLTRARDLERFFGAILPNDVTNKLGIREASWAYILRHTHLTPRHVLAIFTHILLAADDDWRRSAKLREQAILDGVSSAERWISKQVIIPFQSFYPDIQDIVRRVCEALPSVFDFKTLMKILRSVEGELDGQLHGELAGANGVAKLLFDMGVIGRFERRREDADEGPHYKYARFYFTQDGRPSFERAWEYCMHPIFSGTYEARDRVSLPSSMVVYPDKVELVGR